MGYTDSRGRPEWRAQPFVKTGAAEWRTVTPEPADEDEDSESADKAKEQGNA